MKIVFVFFAFLVFTACDNNRDITKNYTQRINSLWVEIEKSEEELKVLKQEIITIIDDSTEAANWQEKLSTYIGQIYVLDQNLRDVSTILVIQADTLPYFVADSLRPQYIKNYSETANTTMLLNHGLGVITASHIGWFDKIFSDTLYNKKVTIPPYVNKEKVLDYWKQEKNQIKSIGDYELFRLSVRIKAGGIIKNLLTQYKLIWTELKKGSLADAASFHHIKIKKEPKRKRYDGWEIIYNGNERKTITI